MNYSRSPCHICLLPIPADLVCRTHPLFGTTDHVIPKSRGGRSTQDNLAPAHYFCNHKKGAEPLTAALTAECREVIHTELQRIGWRDGPAAKAHYSFYVGEIIRLREIITSLRDSKSIIEERD